MDDRYLYAGLIRLHLLHHAVEEPIYGLAMIEELGRHGYKLSAGTLYPILHGLEEKGYLTSSEERTGSAARRVYRATPAVHSIRRWLIQSRVENCFCPSTLLNPVRQASRTGVYRSQ
jgi:DNA-binding PadR family transcriptional regulator